MSDSEIETTVAKTVKEDSKKSIDIVAETEITDQQNRDALVSAAIKTIGGAIPGLREFMSVVDNVNQEVKEQKLGNLLRSFSSRFDNLEIAQAKFQHIVGSRAGMILFHKIIQIVDNGELDEEWLALLANVLDNITDENIEGAFEERGYLLSQIARISPHALIILHKGILWGTVKFQRATTMSGQTIVGDWDTQISTFFAQNAGVTNEDTKLRIAHAFKELESAGMIYITEQKSMGCTQIGARIQNLTN